MAYDNTNSGILSKNDKQREGKKDPEYTGQINIEGVDYWLSGWVREGKRGKFFSLKVRPKDDKNARPAKPKSKSSDDEIPF